MGCGGSKEKVKDKEREKEAAEAEKGSAATEDPHYTTEGNTARDETPKAKATHTKQKDDQNTNTNNNGDGVDPLGGQGEGKTSDQAQGSSTHSNPFNHEDTPMNHSELFPNNQNEEFNIRVGKDKYRDLGEGEELHSMKDWEEGPDTPDSSDFQTVVSAAATTVSMGYTSQQGGEGRNVSPRPPHKSDRDAPSAFVDHDSFTDATSAAFVTPLNNDDALSTVTVQPHGYAYYNTPGMETVPLTTTVKKLPPQRGERSGSLRVTQVRNNSVTASAHGEIPPSPYLPVRANHRSPAASSAREAYEPYGVDTDAAFFSCRSMQTVTPPTSSRAGGAVVDTPRSLPGRPPFSEAPAPSAAFYTAVEDSREPVHEPKEASPSLHDTESNDSFSPPDVPDETKIHPDRLETSTTPSEHGSKISKSSKREDEESSTETSLPRPSPRRPTTAYRGDKSERASTVRSEGQTPVPSQRSEAGEADAEAASSVASTRRSFKTAVSAQTQATTIAPSTAARPPPSASSVDTPHSSTRHGITPLSPIPPPPAADHNEDEDKEGEEGDTTPSQRAGSQTGSSRLPPRRRSESQTATVPQSTHSAAASSQAPPSKTAASNSERSTPRSFKTAVTAGATTVYDVKDTPHTASSSRAVGGEQSSPSDKTEQEEEKKKEEEEKVVENDSNHNNEEEKEEKEKEEETEASVYSEDFQTVVSAQTMATSVATAKK